MAIEKGQVGLDWLKVQSAEVIRLADEYEVSKYLEYGFEACGRSMIWLGDMMAEVAGMRTCCLKVNRQGSVDRALVQFGNTPQNRTTSLEPSGIVQACGDELKSIYQIILEAISNSMEKC